MDKNMTLQERLRALTEPSREVDAEIACAITGENEWPILSRNKQPKPTNKEGLVVGVTAGGTIGHISAPHYTKSLDAAVELVERELPGWWWLLERVGGEHRAYAGGDIGYSTAKGKHALPAVALLLALIEAKGISD